MEYLDFSSVITTIRKYISDAHNMNQIDMMYQLFVSFLNSEESKDFDFDNGLVCRWFNGQAKISPRITGYYMNNHKRNLLAADMHRNVLPLMYDSAMAVRKSIIFWCRIQLYPIKPRSSFSRIILVKQKRMKQDSLLLHCALAWSVLL